MRKPLRIIEDKRDFREGIEFMGEWYTPEQLHTICQLRMAAFDQLPKKTRDRINEKGKP